MHLQKAENAPEGAPTYCAGGNCPVKDTCPYNSERIYIENPDGFWDKSIFRNSVADIRVSVANHLTGFAAEEARAENFHSLPFFVCW